MNKFIVCMVVISIIALSVVYYSVPAFQEKIDNFIGAGVVEGSSYEDTQYSIFLILDGTDRISNEYAVPVIEKADYLLDFIDRNQKIGLGRLWIGYVDDNSLNNETAYFDLRNIPQPVGEQPKRISGEPKSQYDTRLEKWKKDSEVNNREAIISNMRYDIERITKMAYTEKIARNRRGSDIFGAINTAIRALETVQKNTSEIKHICLISDGHDNVNGIKSMLALPSDIEILLVNASGSKSSFDFKVIELDSFVRMEEYIFSR